MLKFKNIASVVKEYLKIKIPQADIQIGKYGELPSITPAVWIYIEPYRNLLNSINSGAIFKQAKLLIFAIADASIDKYGAMLSSVDLIELVEQHLFSDDFMEYLNDHPDNYNQIYSSIRYAEDQPLNFDNIYSDFAVAYLEIIIPYV
ncbi:MAG: hypothetical protein AMXMBFR51_21010 [Ignavibacteriota bacterium]